MKKILLLIICISLFGCNKPEKTKLVLDWSINTNHTGLYVALEKGFYKEEGIDLEIQTPPEDGAVALVAANKANYGISFQEVLAPALDQDNPLKVSAIASILQHNKSGIVSLKDSNIKNFKDLENKNLATWDTDMFNKIMANLVKKVNGDYNKVKKVQGDVSDPLAALQSQIDAIWVYYAWDVIALQTKGVEVNYLDIPKANNVFDYYSPVIIVNDQFALKNKEEVTKFLKATKKGYEYAINNPKEAGDILLKYAPELDKKMVYASQNYLTKEYQSDAKVWGQIDKKRWNNFYEWLYDNKIVKKDIKDKGLNTSFLDSLK